MHVRALGAALALALLVTACGDDDDTAVSGDDAVETETETGTDTETETETDTETETSGGEGEQAAGDGEFCSAYQEMLAGDPSPEQIREVAEIAPEAAQEPLETIAAGFEEDPEGFFDTEEFSTAFGEVGAAANEECADETFEVVAVDYAFEGVPSELEPGTYGVELTNEGDEFHEMVVFRKAEGTTESFDEIFAMEDQDAAQGLVVEAGGTFAPPGSGSSGLFELSEPGEYAVVCFIPVGSTPDAEGEPSGPPHLTQGMISTFTVG